MGLREGVRRLMGSRRGNLEDVRRREEAKGLEKEMGGLRKRN